LQNILLGLSELMQPGMLFMVLSGVLLGVIVGAIPGLTTNMAIAIMVPVTYSMSPAAALVFLSSIYCAGAYAGSIASILIGIPGTGAAVATTIDGHPLAKKGRAGLAIYLATVSSVFGGIVSTFVLVIAAPQLARLAVKFGPAEFFTLGLFGMITVSSMSESSSIMRGLIAGAFGLLLSVVGISPIAAAPRLTFGLYEIIDGFPLVPVFIGLFGFGQILNSAVTETKGYEGQVTSIGKMWHNFRTWLQYWKTFLRSSLIGTILGMIPGPGCVAAAFFAHDREKRASKTPEKFGTGMPEGVVATESANNAVVGSSLVPLLGLGVPGNSVSALFLGALLLHGLRPGPSLFRNSPEVAFSMVLAMILANLLMGPVGLLVGRGFSYFLKVPKGLLQALILALCAVGTFSLRNNVGDVYIMLGFGVLSYFLKKLDVPLSPIVLGIILGPMIERSLHQALTLFDGSMAFLVTRPIPIVLLLLTLWSLFGSIRQAVRRGRGGAKAIRKKTDESRRRDTKVNVADK